MLPQTNVNKIRAQIMHLPSTNQRTSNYYRNTDSVSKQLELDRIAALFFYRVHELTVLPSRVAGIVRKIPLTQSVSAPLRGLLRLQSGRLIMIPAVS